MDHTLLGAMIGELHPHQTSVAANIIFESNISIKSPESEVNNKIREYSFICKRQAARDSWLQTWLHEYIERAEVSTRNGGSFVLITWESAFPQGPRIETLLREGQKLRCWSPHPLAFAILITTEVIIFWCFTHCFGALHRKPKQYSFRTVYRKKHNLLVPPASYQNYRFAAKGISIHLAMQDAPTKTRAWTINLSHTGPRWDLRWERTLLKGMLGGNCVRIFLGLNPYQRHLGADYKIFVWASDTKWTLLQPFEPSINHYGARLSVAEQYC